MIEAIRRVGEYAVKGNLTKDTYLNEICLKVPETRRDRERSFEQHIVFLNFNTKTKKIDLSFEKANASGKDSGREYLWIGNNPGPKEQIFLTTDSPIYLFTKTLPNLMKIVSGNFEGDIKLILNEFFNDEIVDPSKFELLDEIVVNLRNDVAKVKKGLESLNTKKELNEEIKELKRIYDRVEVKLKISLKEEFGSVKKQAELKCEELMNSNIKDILINKYRKDILKRVKSPNKRESALTNDLLLCRGIKKDEVAIYTIKLNGDLLAKNPEYRNIVYYKKVNVLFDRKNKLYKENLTIGGKCSLCERDNLLTTSNATNLDFKFYMTDKIGFSSNLDGMFTKNYNICKECYQYLMIAENFINNNLSTRIGGLKTYVIPHFIFKNDKLDLMKFSKYIKYSTYAIENLDSLKDFNKMLETFREYEDNKNNFTINYVFYHNPKSEFKVLKLIKDMPPSRLNFISNKIQEISNLEDDYWDNKHLKIDLNRIWECIPIKKGEAGSYPGFSRYLEIIDAIFSDKTIDYNFLINQFVEVIRIIKFERKGYNVRIDQGFSDKVIQLNFLLLLFAKLRLLGGIDMDEKSNLNIGEIGEGMLPKGILDYWSHTALYGEGQKRALFLLGYLIGEIGNAQNVTGHKKKPILEKINFQGMDVEKLLRLSNDVLEKLKHYDQLKYNEDVYSVLKILLDNNIANWNLSNQENVFYSLSGYAFSNYLGRMRNKNMYFEEQKKVFEYIEKTRDDGARTSEIEKILEEAKNFAEDYKYSAARKLLKDIKIS